MVCEDDDDDDAVGCACVGAALRIDDTGMGRSTMIAPPMTGGRGESQTVQRVWVSRFDKLHTEQVQRFR